MRVSRGVALRSVLASLVVGTIAFILLVEFAPNSLPFSTDNYGWNGLQQVASHYVITPVSSLGGLQPQHSVLLLLQPTVNYSQSDAKAVEQFAQGGGIVLVGSSSGAADSLLGGIGSGVRVEGQYAINDQVYNWKSSSLPTILVLPGAGQQFSYLGKVNGIALNSPSPLIVEPDSQAQVVAISSPLSSEVNRNTGPSLGGLIGGPIQVSAGSFPEVVVDRIGSGGIVIVGDSLLFTNSAWTLADNQVLARNLMANSTVYLDTSHWQPNTGEGIKAVLGSTYAMFSGAPLRYLLVLAFAGASIVILPSLAELRGEDKSEQSRRFPKRTILNKEALERIRRDREKYGVQPE
jgi:Domain of unknown function (DUF4350)